MQLPHCTTWHSFVAPQGRQKLSAFVPGSASTAAGHPAQPVADSGVARPTARGMAIVAVAALLGCVCASTLTWLLLHSPVYRQDAHVLHRFFCTLSTFLARVCRVLPRNCWLGRRCTTSYVSFLQLRLYQRLPVRYLSLAGDQPCGELLPYSGVGVTVVTAGDVRAKTVPPMAMLLVMAALMLAELAALTPF
jgi:hypothetical protein